VRYARTGQDKVGAIAGGFHLRGPMFEPIIAPTVEALADLSPSLLVSARSTAGGRASRWPHGFPTRS
jgi:7,8-dihydropterin-6-yl-methyl-4-(beta-D-ribofuranosyl)aminobenzene 5'-phosphate synthase